MGCTFYFSLICLRGYFQYIQVCVLNLVSIKFGKSIIFGLGEYWKTNDTTNGGKQKLHQRNEMFWQQFLSRVLLVGIYIFLARAVYQ